MYQTTTLALATPITISIPSRPNGKSSTLNLRASFSSTSNFPLASRIIVKNLGYSVGESSLQKEFSNFGEIAEVKLVKDDERKRSKAFVFIQYTCQDDAILAMENMDRKIFDGRLIYVDLAKPGKETFRGYPKASGPPPLHLREQDEVADCWY
ncbi:glycine-rich RNA-binding protein 4, mitochondrial [Ricinus communis]|uniref:RNA binding protein, putative n=1 Tax=Ricinus communis TaxID=3988 RepID=B9T5A2_RICCO|nr:glycine-rich RNA-binding protein 4, mitochondrial [Ricinus communis]EEF28964.1 RNA binding protein, putative [Ricinus communis]|eukprot:XP_002533421.1 glycine-rich RNA-binding protein 4, mitochondrial [Ricinus communis]